MLADRRRAKFQLLVWNYIKKCSDANLELKL